MPSQNPVSVTVDHLGYPWVANDQGEIYNFNGFEWIKQIGDAHRFGIGVSGKVWALNAYGQPNEILVQERIYLNAAAHNLGTWVNGSKAESNYRASNPAKRVHTYSTEFETSASTCSHTHSTGTQSEWTADILRKAG